MEENVRGHVLAVCDNNVIRSYFSSSCYQDSHKWKCMGMGEMSVNQMYVSQRFSRRERCTETKRFHYKNIMSDSFIAIKLWLGVFNIKRNLHHCSYTPNKKPSVENFNQK